MMAAVTSITLGELLGPSAGAHAAARISDLVLDSRDARAGAAFVAVQGGCEHGLRYAADALARGAEAVLYDPEGLDAAAADPSARSAALVGAAMPPAARATAGARFVAVPGLEGRLGQLAQTLYGPAIGPADLAGVTGTNGKTTVAYLIAQAMTRLGARCGYTGTLGYGVPPELTPHALTTPDCFTLHRELAALGTTRVALEVSSHALAQDRIAGLVFGTAAFTNLTRDHLDAHGDLEAYGRAKARLFARDGLRHAVLNMDDPFAARLAAALPESVVPIRVSAEAVGGNRLDVTASGEPRGAGAAHPERDPGAEPAERHRAGGIDIAATVRSRGLGGLELRVTARGGETTRAAGGKPTAPGIEAGLVSSLIGDFNAENLLVALGVLVAWQTPLADACAALGACAPPPGRLEILGGGSGAGGGGKLRQPGAPWVVIDYAHTPDGLERVLDVLGGVAVGEVWCVFGCGGDRDRGKRALMGGIAAAGAQHVLLTDDNPRSEDPARIVRDILEGVGPHPSVAVEHDRRAAIARAVRMAKPGDVVLIAGKGHESSQLTGGVERPFSDRDAALEILGELA